MGNPTTQGVAAKASDSLGQEFAQITREQEIALRTQAIIEGSGVDEGEDGESEDNPQ